MQYNRSEADIICWILFISIAIGIGDAKLKYKDSCSHLQGQFEVIILERKSVIYVCFLLVTPPTVSDGFEQQEKLDRCS